MTIDLPKEVEAHMKRVTALAEEASIDPEQSYTARASAMTAVTTMLKELTKTQESLINMERLQRTEQIIVELCKEVLTDEGLSIFLTKLESRLNAIE